MQQNSKCMFCDETKWLITYENFSKVVQKEYNLTQEGSEGDPLGIMQEIEVWPYYQIIWAETRINHGEGDVQNSLGFQDTNRSPNPNLKTKPSES